jgi:hypothetical protein
MQRNFPDAIHVRLRAEELRTPRAITVKICRLIPAATPDPRNDAGRDGRSDAPGNGMVTDHASTGPASSIKATILLDTPAEHPILVNAYGLTTGSGVPSVLNGPHTRGVDIPADRTAGRQPAPIEARGVFASPLRPPST